MLPEPLRAGLAALSLAMLLSPPVAADETPLRRLETGNDSRGWDAVGRLDLGSRGFCTGAMIAPHLVLTAAHCLFDKETGARIPSAAMQFRAGWRNGRAAAYRGIRRAVAHPEYIYGGHEKLGRVAFDLALVELDMPIRLPSVAPFATERQPGQGDEVGVVSYAQDRSDAPSLQEVCHILARQTGVLVLSCNVDFGSSGAPIFAMRDGVARVVSIISAKAEYEGRQVALGTTLDRPLDDLLGEIEVLSNPFRRDEVRGSAGAQDSAKFLRP